MPKRGRAHVPKLRPSHQPKPHRHTLIRELATPLLFLAGATALLALPVLLQHLGASDDVTIGVFMTACFLPVFWLVAARGGAEGSGPRNSAGGIAFCILFGAPLILAGLAIVLFGNAPQAPAWTSHYGWMALTFTGLFFVAIGVAIARSPRKPRPAKHLPWWLR
jgi:hypothetical protein